jgi:endonuclease/exonuclease/phosphatase family metal-dependent hydrolase
MFHSITRFRVLGCLALSLAVPAGCGAPDGGNDDWDDETASQAARSGDGCRPGAPPDPNGPSRPTGIDPCPLPPPPPPRTTTFHAQNMGLLVAPAPYKGSDRNDAIGALVNFLRDNQPDVVGLSEVFADGERAQIRRQVADIYPHTMEGPDEADLESDGGLLLLSRFPITARNQTIYRSCAGDDCLANKGVLHARVAVPDQTEVDVFVSHLQSATPVAAANAILGSGPAGSPTDKVKQQLDVLADFVRAVRNIRLPTIIMGDINVDALDPILYSDLRSRLGWPTDLWAATESGPGLTVDDHDSFEPSSHRRGWNDPYRHQSGKRLDYFLVHDGTRIAWQPDATQVITLFNSNGRDSSDHYGIFTTVKDFRPLPPPAGRAPALVQVSLRRFRCFLETDGVTGLLSRVANSDEVELQMDLTAGGGVTSVKTGVMGGIDRGEDHQVRLPALSASNPGGGVIITLNAWEVDAGPLSLFRTGTSHIGAGSIHLDNRDLADLRGGSRELAVRVQGVGGEYVLVAAIRVE